MLSAITCVEENVQHWHEKLLCSFSEVNAPICDAAFKQVVEHI